jgi:hypothetical protein
MEDNMSEWFVIKDRACNIITECTPLEPNTDVISGPYTVRQEAYIYVAGYNRGYEDCGSPIEDEKEDIFKFKIADKVYCVVPQYLMPGYTVKEGIVTGITMNIYSDTSTVFFSVANSNGNHYHNQIDVYRTYEEAQRWADARNKQKETK